MKEIFNEGDVLLYFNDHASYFVILDQIDSEYFTIVANQEGVYEYGFKIKIRILKRLKRRLLGLREFGRGIGSTSI
jgi:hypothetical protein